MYLMILYRPSERKSRANSVRRPEARKKALTFRRQFVIMRNARGDVSEWLKEAVLKTVDVKASVGSNPTISAIFSIIARGNTQVAIRGSPAKGVDGVKPCVGSNPTFRATSPPTSNRSRRLFMLCIQNHRSPSPLRLLSEKGLARFTCSLASAFTTTLSLPTFFG